MGCLERESSPLSKQSDVCPPLLLVPARRHLHLEPLLDLPPPDQPPVLLDAPRERDLLALLRADRRRQLQLREVVLDGHDARAGAHGPDVEHQHLALGQLRDLGLLLAVLRAHAEQAAQQEEVDLELAEDVGQRADLAEDLFRLNRFESVFVSLGGLLFCLV